MANKLDEYVDILDMTDKFYKTFYNTPRKKLFYEIADDNYLLKMFFVRTLDAKNIEDAKQKLITRVDNYYKKCKQENDQIPVVRGRPETNVENIFKESKKQIQLKQSAAWAAEVFDTNRPNRETLFKIAFAIKLDEKKCKEMFSLAGQYDIHIGGDPQESIAYFCLKKEKSYLDAVKLYETYCKNCEVTEEKQGKKRRISQRSNDIANLLEYASNIENYDKSLSSFLDVLYKEAASFSYYSGRVRQYILKRLEDENVDSPRLYVGFSRMFSRKTGSAHSNLRKILNEESQPTRDFVCLLLTMDYYQEYQQNSRTRSLEEYVNSRLADEFNLFELDERRKLDALLIELSKYKLSERRRNAIKYGTNIWVIFDEEMISYHDQKYIHLASYVLKRYILDKYKAINPISSAKLIEKNCFLDKTVFGEMLGDKKK